MTVNCLFNIPTFTNGSIKDSNVSQQLLFFFLLQRTKITVKTPLIPLAEMIEWFISLYVVHILVYKSRLPPRGGLDSPREWAVCASQTMSTLCRDRRSSILDLEEETSSQSRFRRQEFRADQEWVTYPDREGLIYTLVPGAPPSEPRRSACPPVPLKARPTPP